MNYKSPDVDKLRAEYLLSYKEEFLSLNNLKIGDTVVARFMLEEIHRKDRGSGMDKITFGRNAEAILKEDENGFLYAESTEEYHFYSLTSSGHYGRRGYKEWYKSEKRKAIHKYGSGFIS